MIKFPLKLYGYSQYTKFLNNLYNNKDFPRAIIVNGEEGIGKKIFILNLLEVILKKKFMSINHDLLIDNFGNIVPMVKIINNLNNSLANTEIIREISKFSYKSSFDELTKFIVIFNIEQLNIYSTNSLLKILEQPPVNTFFILTKNSSKNLIKTLLSRCFVLNIKLFQSEKDEIFKKLLLDNGLDNFINYNFYHKYEAPGLILEKILYLKNNNLMNEKLIDIIFYCFNDFKKNKNSFALKYAIQFSIYFFKLNINKNFDNFYYVYDKFKSKLNNGIVYNSDLESVFNILKKLK